MYFLLELLCLPGVHLIQTLLGQIWFNVIHVSPTFLANMPANTKHLYDICTMLDQRRKRWADVVQMLYKLVFAGM